jgi:hypothetical protein
MKAVKKPYDLNTCFRQFISNAQKKSSSSGNFPGRSGKRINMICGAGE